MSKGFDSRDLDQRYLDILAAARQHFGADRAPRERFHEWYEGKYGKKPDAQKAYLPPQIVKNGYLQVGDGSYWLDRSLMNKEPLSESGPGNSGEELERDATVEEELETAVNTAFSLERDLKRSLLSNLDQLVSGLKLYMRDGHTGQQFRTDDVGVIDILALGPLNELVIVELKAGRADDKAIAQILRYMGWATKKLAEPRQAVTGIIVANDFTDALKYAAAAVPSIQLKRYEVNFRFTYATL